MPTIIHKCAECDEVRFKGGEFCERHRPLTPQERLDHINQRWGGVLKRLAEEEEKEKRAAPADKCDGRIEEEVIAGNVRALLRRPCPNPAQSPFTCCLPCRKAYEERCYQEDRARREAEEEAK
jgi:hypothetical protein